MFAPTVRRHIQQGLRALLPLLAVLWLLLVLQLAPRPAHAQGVELATLQTAKSDGALTVDFVARVTLPKAVEDALLRGMPIYFVADVQLYRNRWYWRDERVARVSRSWRLAFQPLTTSWRVSLAGFNRPFRRWPKR